jgi:hypothetical protein
MPKKRMPVAERRRDLSRYGCSFRWPLAGNRPDASLAAGLERALTWAGEPLNAEAGGPGRTERVVVNPGLVRHAGVERQRSRLAGGAAARRRRLVAGHFSVPSSCLPGSLPDDLVSAGASRHRTRLDILRTREPRACAYRPAAVTTPGFTPAAPRPALPRRTNGPRDGGRRAENPASPLCPVTLQIPRLMRLTCEEESSLTTATPTVSVLSVPLTAKWPFATTKIARPGARPTALARSQAAGTCESTADRP